MKLLILLSVILAGAVCTGIFSVMFFPIPYCYFVSVISGGLWGFGTQYVYVKFIQ